MMEDYVWDWQRIFFGSQPLLFYAEILLRIGVLYVYTLIALRLLGRRSAGELTPLDLVIVISLGSAVGDPMFYPEVPILFGIVVITVVTLLQAGIINLTNRAENIEQIVKGKPLRVVADGVIDRQRLSTANISREELFMALRQQGFESLGEVDRMYIETDGKPSIYAAAKGDVRPGRPITPPWDVASPTRYRSGQAVPEAGYYSTTHTGLTRHFDANETFPQANSKQTEWVSARL